MEQTITSIKKQVSTIEAGEYQSVGSFRKRQNKRGSPKRNINKLKAKTGSNEIRRPAPAITKMQNISERRGRKGIPSIRWSRRKKGLNSTGSNKTRTRISPINRSDILCPPGAFYGIIVE